MATTKKTLIAHGLLCSIVQTYNQHVRLLFSDPGAIAIAKFTQVEGADIVMKSTCSNPKGRVPTIRQPERTGLSAENGTASSGIYWRAVNTTSCRPAAKTSF